MRKRSGNEADTKEETKRKERGENTPEKPSRINCPEKISQKFKEFPGR